MDSLFSKNGLSYPSWLSKAVEKASDDNRSGKEARYFIYCAIWSRLQRAGYTRRGQAVIYPDELATIVQDLNPDDSVHKDMGRPNVTLKQISRFL